VRLVTYDYLPVKAWQVFGYGDAMKGDLHVNLLHALMLPFMMLAGAWKLSKLLREYDASLIQAHWAVPNTFIALAGRFLARSRARVFTSFPGSDVTAIARAGSAGKVLAKVIARSDYLSCNSSDLKEDLVRAGIPQERIELVIYGVDADAMKFDPDARKRVRAAHGIGDDEVLLLSIGRFVAKKGFATAIRAMPAIRASHPQARLMLVGSGVLEPQYRELIAESGVGEWIDLPGEVKPAQLKDYYSACDIFLMPSERYPSDGLNVVVPEAMACGRAIVSSSVGGNDLVVVDGVNGRLHRPADPQDLADRAGPLIDDPVLRASMGRESRRLIDEQFNWNAIAAHYLACSRQPPA
jgi:glycosyltransferase involved in cell wall biosynthesis